MTSTIDRNEALAADVADAQALFEEAHRLRRRRRWVGAALAVTVIGVAVRFLTVGGQPTSNSSDNGSASLAPSPGVVASATWRVASPTVWHHGLPGNYLGFGPSTMLTCAVGSASTCYVMLQANGVRPDGTISALPYLAPLSTSAYRSTDAGTTWIRLPLPQHTWLSSNLACPGATTCEVGAIVGATAGSTPGQTGLAELLTTVDGGQSWLVHDLPAWVGIVTYLSCPTSSDCVMLAWPRDADVIGGVQPFAGSDRFFPTPVLSTDDGGARWSSGTLPSGPASVHYQLSSLTCPTTTRCVVLATRARIVDTAVGGTGYKRADNADLLLSSGDGGHSWTVASLPSTLTAQQLVPVAVACGAGQSRCVAIAAPSPSSSGQQAPIVLTNTNGSPKWTAVPSTGVSALSDQGLANVEGMLVCQAVGHCGVVTSTGIAFTSDGGSNWRATTLPPVPAGYQPAESWVTQTSCLTSGICIALEDMVSVASSSPSEQTGTRVLTDAGRGAATDGS